MSGQCLCSGCVEARLRARDDLRALAAYDQARSAKTSAWTDEERAEMAAQRERDNAPGIEGRFAISAPDALTRRLRAMREARERAGASCP